MWCRQSLPLVILLASVNAETPLHWKIRHPGQEVGVGALSNTWKRRSLRSHLILRYAHPPQTSDIDELNRRGAALVEYVPLKGLIVSAPDWFRTDGLGLASFGTLTATDKLSPLLSPSAPDPYYAVVEFYSDVDMSEARQIVTESQLRVQENASLNDRHLLVYGNQNQYNSLLEWDEVAYIFPASEDLVKGVPLTPCAGALTTQGQIGQSIAIIGAWNGATGQSAALSYAFVNTSQQLPVGAQQSEIVRAFNTWAKYAALSFTPGSASGNQTISVLFGTGNHGDAYPFAGNVVAHTFYPAPTNQEPLAGDMHFNDVQSWHIGADVDLFSVALHETGHALGLGHSDQPGAVMYPYYKKAADLSQDDVSAILTLYAARSGTGPSASPTQLELTITAPPATTTSSTLTLSGTVSGGTAPIQVNWTTSAGLSGVATVVGQTWSCVVPLNAGLNSITVTASDAQPSRASQAVSVTLQSAPASGPVLLSIDNPATTTNSPLIDLSGTVSGGSGGFTVAWNTDQGFSGNASISAGNWTATAIPLNAGRNAITVKATDAKGSTSSQTVSVVLQQPPVTPSTPVVQIVSPVASGGTYSTGSPTLSFSGIASDTSGISLITWSSSSGGSGIASGTSNWTFGPVSLSSGAVQFTVTAHAVSGATASQTVQVSFVPVASPTPPGTGGGTNTTAPTLVILSPALATESTSNSSIVFSGTASDAAGVTAVSWSTSNGDSGTATGTTSWRTSAIPLYQGANTVTIKALDAAGNSAWRAVVVTKY